jgi:hypothetical protein
LLHARPEVDGIDLVTHVLVGCHYLRTGYLDAMSSSPGESPLSNLCS